MRATSFGVGALIVLAAMLAGCSSETTGQANRPNDDVSAADRTGSPAPRRGLSREEMLHPQVEVSTSLGKFTLELDAEHAPITVSNFLDYVDRGYYNDTIFHQVVRDYVALAGSYTPELETKPAGPVIRNEARNGLSNRRGTVAMARSPDVIDSSTSQFFINLADNSSLDHEDDEAEAYGYCVFGRVIAGLETVDRIGQAPVESSDGFDQKPVETVRIESIRRLR